MTFARKNVEIQQSSLDIIQKRFQQGVVGELNVRQAGAQLAITESLIPKLEEAHRRVQNGLCLLVGMPPGSLQADLGEPRPIPAAPAEVIVGIPADLLRRRPDVRRAERQAAAQSARIGVAEAEFYPHLAITGTISFEAEQFGDLLDWRSIGGKVGPGLQWNILNYGRIRNSVRVEERAIPASRDRLPEHGPGGQQGGRRRHRRLLARAAAPQIAATSRGRGHPRVADRPALVRARGHRLPAGARFSTCGRLAARRVGAEPGPSRDEPRGRLQSHRRRLDDAGCHPTCPRVEPIMPAAGQPPPPDPLPPPAERIPAPLGNHF